MARSRALVVAAALSGSAWAAPGAVPGLDWPVPTASAHGWTTGPRLAPPEQPATPLGAAPEDPPPRGWWRGRPEAVGGRAAGWWGQRVELAHPGGAARLSVPCGGACRVFVGGALAHRRDRGAPDTVDVLDVVAAAGPVAVELWRQGHPAGSPSVASADQTGHTDSPEVAVECAAEPQVLHESPLVTARCGDAALAAGDLARAVRLWQASLSAHPVQPVLRDRLRLVAPDAAPPPPVSAAPEAEAVVGLPSHPGAPVSLLLDRVVREVTAEGQSVTWGARRYRVEVASPELRLPLPVGAEVLDAQRDRGADRWPVFTDAQGHLWLRDLQPGDAVAVAWRTVERAPSDGGLLLAADPLATARFEARLCWPAFATPAVAWRAPPTEPQPVQPARAEPALQPGQFGGPVRCVERVAEGLGPAPAAASAAELLVDRPALTYALHAEPARWAAYAAVPPQPAPEDWAWAATTRAADGPGATGGPGAAEGPGATKAMAAAVADRARSEGADVHRLRGLWALLGVESQLAWARPRSAPWLADLPPSSALLTAPLVYVPALDAWFGDRAEAPSADLVGTVAWILGPQPQRRVVAGEPVQTVDEAELRATAPGGAEVVVTVRGPGVRDRLAALSGLFWLDRAEPDRVAYRRAQAAEVPAPIPPHPALVEVHPDRSLWLGPPRCHLTRLLSEVPVAQPVAPGPLAVTWAARRQGTDHLATRAVCWPGGLVAKGGAPLRAAWETLRAADLGPALAEVPEVPAADRVDAVATPAPSVEPGGAADGTP